VETIAPGPCVDATLGAGLLWVLRGTFTTTTTSTGRVEIAPGRPTRDLVGCDVDTGTVVHEVRIEPARRIAFGRTRDQLWTANGAIEVRRLPDLETPARLSLPAGENAVEVFPDAGLAFTTVGGRDSTTLACIAVG
jgi:hypothetical protein